MKHQLARKRQDEERKEEMVNEFNADIPDVVDAEPAEDAEGSGEMSDAESAELLGGTGIQSVASPSLCEG